MNPPVDSSFFSWYVLHLVSSVSNPTRGTRIVRFSQSLRIHVRGHWIGDLGQMLQDYDQVLMILEHYSSKQNFSSRWTFRQDRH